MRTAELAAIFHVTTRTIRNWVDEGMPVEKAGTRGAGGEATYDLEACTAWYFAKNAQRLDLIRALTRRTHEQADALEMENNARRAEIISTEVAQQTYAGFAEVIKAKLETLPMTLAERFGDVKHGKAAVAEVRKAVDEMIDEIDRGRDAEPHVD